MDVGESAVRYARECIRSEVLGVPQSEVPDGPAFREERGVFVTVNTFPAGELRGCIGYPYPVFPLAEAIRGSAESACHDPRFEDLGRDELEHITVEVTLLTVPEDLEAASPRELRDKVVIGRDGLMIECMGRRGLLLPQVPVEWGWDAEEYLTHLSLKAGLPPDAWTWDTARFKSFRGEVFSEKSPGGDVERRDV